MKLSKNFSAQSIPCNKKALPLTTSAKDFFNDRVSPAKTSGGYFLFYLILNPTLFYLDTPANVLQDI